MVGGVSVYVLPSFGSASYSCSRSRSTRHTRKGSSFIGHCLWAHALATAKRLCLAARSSPSTTPIQPLEESLSHGKSIGTTSRTCRSCHRSIGFALYPSWFSHLFSHGCWSSSSPVRFGGFAQVFIPQSRRYECCDERSNHALERTADRCEDLLVMTSTLKLEAKLALVSGRSACSR